MQAHLPAAAGRWLCVSHLRDASQKIMEGMNESLPTNNRGSGNTVQDESQPTGLISATSVWFNERKKIWAHSKDWLAEDRRQCEKEAGQTIRTVIFLWTLKCTGSECGGWFPPVIGNGSQGQEAALVSHVPPLGLNLSPALSPPPPPLHCYLQPLISSFSSSTPICLAKWDSMRDFLWENDSPEEKQWNTDGKRMHELASFSLLCCTLGVPFTWNTSSPSLFEGLVQGLLLPAGGLARTKPCLHAFPSVPYLLIVLSADLSVHLSVYLYGTSFPLGIGVVTVCPLFPSPLAVTSTQIFNSSQKNHNFFWKNEKFWQCSRLALLQQNWVEPVRSTQAYTLLFTKAPAIP